MPTNESDGVSTEAGRVGDGNTLSSIEPEAIVFILKKLGETNESDLYDVFSLKEDTGEQGLAFKLSRSQATDVPQSLLDEFLGDGLPDYLRSGPSQHVHIVVSTGSGTGLALNFYNSVLQPLLNDLGIHASEQSANLEEPPQPNTYNLIITQNANSVRDFARNLGRADHNAVRHTVVLLSGDGGVIEMLNGKAPEDERDAEAHLPLIAILPLGTGNALFSSLHKSAELITKNPAPSSLVQSLRTLFTGKAAPLPSFKAEFSPGSRIITYTDPSIDDSGPSSSEVESHADAVSHLYGAIVASYGFHSQLVWESDTPEYRKHGAKRFGMVVQELFKENHAYNAVLELAPDTDSEFVRLQRDQYAYILATMVSNLEKTFTISPASEPLDGQLRLVHFGPVSPQKFMDIMGQAYDGGKHVGMTWLGDDGKTKQVAYEKAGVVKITTRETDARWRKVCIDGTIVELPQDGTMTVRRDRKQHLRILVDKSVLIR